MERTENPWQYVDEAFEHADRAFAAADKAFAAGGKLADRAEPLKPGCHHVRFTTKTWPDRLRLFRRFANMAVAALCRGRAELRFTSQTTKREQQ